MDLRIFYVHQSGRLGAGWSHRHESPEAYALFIRRLGPIPVAFERTSSQGLAVGSDPEQWFPRCKAAIEAGQHYGTRDEALALWAAARLENP